MPTVENGRISKRTWWRQARIALCIAALLIYAGAIFLDLPSPSGARYRQNLPRGVLAYWGVTTTQSVQRAPHWLFKTQALRGWSVFPEGWSWPKIEPAPFSRWIALLGLGFLGAAILRFLERRARQVRWQITMIALIVMILFAYIFQLATIWLKDPHVEQHLLKNILDPHFTGYLQSAVNIKELTAFFSHYDQTIISPNYCEHCRTHPPGPVMLYWILLHIIYRLPFGWQVVVSKALLTLGYVPVSGMQPAVIITAFLGAHGILLAAAFIVVPLYGIARLLAGRHMALPLAALGAVLPGLILMSPEFDQLYATLAAILFYLCLRGLLSARRSAVWGLAAGLLFANCLYWSLGLWVLAIPIFLLVFAAGTGVIEIPIIHSRGRGVITSPGKAFRWLVGFGSGSILPWGLLVTLGGFPLLNVLQAVRRAHLNGITSVRPYAPWVIFNLVDYFQFLGLPLVFVTLLTLAFRIRAANLSVENSSSSTLKPPAKWVQQVTARFNLGYNFYGLLFWIVIGLLDLSGLVRAEVGRIFLFLIPLPLMAIFNAAGHGSVKVRHVHALLAMQFIVCILIGGNWLTP